MAVMREVPTCPRCGDHIEAVHNNCGKKFYGDTFAYWDWDKHKCKISQKILKKVKEFFYNTIEHN